jgi:hypothetical protein
MESIPPLNITFNATQPNWPSHAISRVETSATQRKASMAIKNCSNGKLADSCTTALALSLSLALILACLSERKAGQLTSAISRYQIVPTYLRTPSYFGLTIPLRAMRSRQLSLTLLIFRETTLRGFLTRPSLIDLSYRRDSTPVQLFLSLDVRVPGNPARNQWSAILLHTTYGWMQVLLTSLR